MGAGGVQCSPGKVGPGCPVSSRSQVSSELCYPHPALLRIPRSLLWEGRLPLPMRPVMPTQSPLLVAREPAAGVHRCSSRRSHLESLFFEENLPQRRRRCKLFICPKHEGEMVTKREVFCRRGSEQGSH